jgi:hypothetical protein
MPFLASCSRTAGLVGHDRQHARVGLARVAAAGAAVQRRLEGIVLRAAAMAANEHQRAKLRVSPIMRSAVSTVKTCSLSVKPVRVMRSMRAKDAPWLMP